MSASHVQPVYLLLDTSGSMRGEPIAAVNVGLASMLSTLCVRPGLGELVHLSVSTFDAEVRELVPLQPVSRVRLPLLQVPNSGPTFLGAGLDAFVAMQRRAGGPALPPMLFVMTDGSPTDLQVYEEAIPKVRALNPGRVTAFAAGPKAKAEYLQWLTSDVIRLDTLDGPAFARMFDHVAHSIERSAPSFLPPSPSDITVVL